MTEMRSGESQESFGRWRKSRYSYGTGTCCEVLNPMSGESFFRDSLHPEDAQSRFDSREWTSFLAISRGSLRGILTGLRAGTRRSPDG